MKIPHYDRGDYVVVVAVHEAVIKWFVKVVHGNVRRDGIVRWLCLQV
jgi:hypothetical protein